VGAGADIRAQALRPVMRCMFCIGSVWEVFGGSMRGVKRHILYLAACTGMAAAMGCAEVDNSVEPRCGDGICNGGETPETCPDDCGQPAYCGDGECNGGETSATCPEDCGEVASICGDGVCDADETPETCPKDCAVGPSCGDGRCNGDETEVTCPEDCGGGTENPGFGFCGDAVCDEDDGETALNCPSDCQQDVVIDKVSLATFHALDEVRYRVYHDLHIATAGKKTGNSNDFFRFPYPSSLRTDEHGRPVLAGLHLPGLASSLPMVETMLGFVQTERSGFPAIGAVYFRLTDSVDTASLAKTPDETILPGSCFQLINVEKRSPRYGERVPVYVTFRPESTALWAPNTLVMRPVPGVGPHPGERYVAIVQDCLTSSGRKFDQSRKLRYILSKAAPNEIGQHTDAYVDALKELGYDFGKIRAMAGYVTSNPAEEMHKVARDLKGRGSVVTNANGVAVGTYTLADSRGHVFVGKFRTRNYLEGVAPYNAPGSGRIRFSETGQLLSIGKEETVTFAVTVPSAAMPAEGYPIIVYGHGTGGDARSHCRNWWGNDEGVTLIRNGVPVSMLGFDACLQGERGSASSMTDMIFMFVTNPIAVRESVRQTVIDMLVWYDILDRGVLVLPPPPGKTENVIFDPSYGLFMGHSQGTQEAGLLLGLTGSIKNAFLSAGGGGILVSFTSLAMSVDLAGFFKFDNMKVSDIVGNYLMGLKEGELSVDAFITNQFVQPLMDPIEPLNYTHLFIKEPIAGAVSKNIAQTIGLGDENTPQEIQFAMATAIGLPTVGEMYAVSDAMRLAKMDKALTSPVSNNIVTKNGNVTGGVMQFTYTSGNPHFVIYYVPSAQRTYVDFFKSVLEGKPTVSVSGQTPAK